MKIAVSNLAIAVLVVGLMLLIDTPYLGTLLSLVTVIGYLIATNQFKKLGFDKPNNLRQTLFIALSMAFVIVIASFYMLIPMLEVYTGVDYTAGNFNQLKGNFSFFISSLIIGWIFGGLFEEIIFRGFMINSMIKILPENIGKYLSVFLTAFIFGFLHEYQGINGQILTGFVGLILGQLYIFNDRRIWLNVFVHGFINTFSMTLLFLGWNI